VIHIPKPAEYETEVRRAFVCVGIVTPVHAEPFVDVAHVFVPYDTAKNRLWAKIIESQLSAVGIDPVVHVAPLSDEYSTHEVLPV
jgi:hypothetical protein